MGKTRGDNLAPAIALGEPGGERSGPGPLLARYVGVAVMFVGLAGLAPLAVLPAYPDEVALAPCFIFPGIGAAMAGYLVYFASPDPAPAPALPAGRPPRARCWSGFSPSPSTRCPTWPRGCSPPSRPSSSPPAG